VLAARFSEEYADADGARTGLFQSLYLPKTNGGGELVALAGHGFRGGSTACHGARDEVLSNFAQVSFQFRVSSFRFRCNLSFRHD
jgi:hypothetical protein